MTGYNFDAFAPKAKKIFIDIDINEINKHKFNVDYKIVCDLKRFLDKVNSIDFSLNILQNILTIGSNLMIFTLVLLFMDFQLL